MIGAVPVQVPCGGGQNRANLGITRGVGSHGIDRSISGDRRGIDRIDATQRADARAAEIDVTGHRGGVHLKHQTIGGVERQAHEVVRDRRRADLQRAVVINFEPVYVVHGQGFGM